MSDAYSAHIATGATTLCRCFRLERADGVVYGFTDHDAPVTFDGLTYAPEAALDASEAAASLGLAPDEMDAAGALSADFITEDDLTAGAYDGAEVLAYDVNWRDPAARRLLGRYRIGQVERGRLAFRAELRSLAAGLDRKEGRTHSALCDVTRLGDARCKLALGPWQAGATVTAVDGGGTEINVATGSGLPPALLARGVVTWQSGANAGAESDIRGGAGLAGGWAVSLWRAPPRPIANGDAVTITVGCDRSWATCRGTFNNAANFRGFPFMPGPDIAGEYAIPGRPGQNGGSRFG